MNFPEIDPDEMTGPSCALDVAEEGGHNLETVGQAINITRERVRQIVEAVFEKPQMRKHGERHGLPNGYESLEPELHLPIEGDSF